MFIKVSWNIPLEVLHMPPTDFLCCLKWIRAGVGGGVRCAGGKE